MSIQKQTGFTIVELLIVIVVIGILAAITIVAYRGVQDRAYDAQRTSDIKAIAKGLEAYYLDNGKYPAGFGGTAPYNSGWSTTSDSSWNNLKSTLVPKYMSKFPVDPKASSGANVLLGSEGYGYAYFSNYSGGYCGAGVSQMYILVYRMVNDDGKDDYTGACTSPLLQYEGVKNYRVVK